MKKIIKQYSRTSNQIKSRLLQLINSRNPEEKTTLIAKIKLRLDILEKLSPGNWQHQLLNVALLASLLEIEAATELCFNVLKKNQTQWEVYFKLATLLFASHCTKEGIKLINHAILHCNPTEIQISEATLLINSVIKFCDFFASNSSAYTENPIHPVRQKKNLNTITFLLEDILMTDMNEKINVCTDQLKEINDRYVDFHLKKLNQSKKYKIDIGILKNLLKNLNPAYTNNQTIAKVFTQLANKYFILNKVVEAAHYATEACKLDPNSYSAEDIKNLQLRAKNYYQPSQVVFQSKNPYACLAEKTPNTTLTLERTQPSINPQLKRVKQSQSAVLLNLPNDLLRSELTSFLSPKDKSRLSQSCFSLYSACKLRPFEKVLGQLEMELQSSRLKNNG